MPNPITERRDRFAAAVRDTPARWNIETTDEPRSSRLHLYGAIGGWFGGVDAAELVPAIRDMDVDTLEVFVNSPGGDVYDAVAIRNALRQHPARVVVTIDGLAASAASFIACAGDEVVMGENAEVMIHDAWTIAMGDAEDMRKAGDDLDRLSDNIASMYAAKAGGEPAAWRELMKAETWYSAAEAVAAGLADRLDSETTTETAGDEAPAGNLFDLSMYAHAGRRAAAAPIPAAALATNREETNTVPEITEDRIDQLLTQQRNEFERIVLAHAAAPAPADAGPSWPTAGAFLKDLAGGSSAAMAFYERMTADAYTGAGTGDTNTPNTWVRDAIHLINRNRRIINTFSRQPLPAEGMTLEYLQLSTNSISVSKQAKEGDDLPKGKITLKADSTPVETYGGYTELSRQVIDRANAAYLTTANTAMDLEYARATEEVVRDLVREIIATQLAGDTHPLTLGAAATAYDWLDLVVDAADLFDDRGYTLDGSLVSKDVFKKLIRLEDTNGNSLMRVWGQGTNQVGELDLTGLKGDLAGIEFRILPDAPANTIEFHNQLAVTTWESANAPFKLQDQNILNLTEAFSKYGYLAAASQFPDAIEAVKVGA
ncbi:ATP-dependent protease ClpP, protease subunit [Leifsonia sp. 98AMF]|uniref:head maturation protease, ClpP-related n=1 Tax=unclassified Leifsonia TaxID=2663824 RepID=UPI00087DC45F|nr:MULTISPECIES: head maturation protease, ClpP-related [unclassified Leifsonia]SDH16087.1 ATP-dependent protease ClpP, protease subunit [Leifsonia sp. 197AMF]SDJ22201.1 ATP-dependent protease ClpP, protease subunit [Leifsonia sp. 466MF]SDK61523.1 ATP-dependent protease ClpP, protease subunit [Leifsonia sp. 157MF]SDN43887.1 ATP-dependent protease ClpP, protease subunit [Leifsonia sp. 509MF]SEN67203.1 ATP-dependent protease ClpP, protease subunit [Leifsonia sp. 467MF]